MPAATSASALPTPSLDRHLDQALPATSRIEEINSLLNGRVWAEAGTQWPPHTLRSHCPPQFLCDWPSCCLSPSLCGSLSLHHLAPHALTREAASCPSLGSPTEAPSICFCLYKGACIAVSRGLPWVPGEFGPSVFSVLSLGPLTVVLDNEC